MEIYYDHKLRKKRIKEFQHIAEKYENSCNLDIMICETKKDSVYGESIFFENGPAIININFNAGEVEDTFVHELAHCIIRERKHNLNWRRKYRELKKRLLNAK
jgi:hypothetical protein|nr:MAG TPA: SprT-like domain-containing protein Spartan/DNA Complex repair, protease, DNA BINDING [Caudoviricetes sp.]